jgi:hypothetical protein
VPNNRLNLKAFYVSCARLYLIDRILWGAVFASKEAIFYTRVEDDPRWQAIAERREEVVLNEDIALITSG